MKDVVFLAIPWEEHLAIWGNYYGSSQTAERIAERGGFGIKESAKYYKMNPIVVWFTTSKNYPKMDEEWTKIRLTFEDGGIRWELL